MRGYAGWAGFCGKVLLSRIHAWIGLVAFGVVGAVAFTRITVG